MNDRDSFLVCHNTDLQESSTSRRADEHRDKRIVGVERVHSVLQRVQYVLFANAMVPSARFDFHSMSLPLVAMDVNIR